MDSSLASDPPFPPPSRKGRSQLYPVPSSPFSPFFYPRYPSQYKVDLNPLSLHSSGLTSLFLSCRHFILLESLSPLFHLSFVHLHSMLCLQSNDCCCSFVLLNVLLRLRSKLVVCQSLPSFQSSLPIFVLPFPSFISSIHLFINHSYTIAHRISLVFAFSSLFLAPSSSLSLNREGDPSYHFPSHLNSALLISDHCSPLFSLSRPFPLALILLPSTMISQLDIAIRSQVISSSYSRVFYPISSHPSISFYSIHPSHSIPFQPKSSSPQLVAIALMHRLHILCLQLFLTILQVIGERSEEESTVSPSSSSSTVSSPPSIDESRKIRRLAEIEAKVWDISLLFNLQNKIPLVDAFLLIREGYWWSVVWMDDDS